MRLEFRKIDYKVNKEKKTVVALVNYFVRDNDRCPTEWFSAVGIAKATKETFDEEIGKKLARARAEREIFIQYNNFLKKQFNKAQDSMAKIMDAWSKNKRNLEHQKEYIKTF